MPHFKLITVLLFYLTFSSFKQLSYDRQTTRWVVMKGGSLRVDGSTNINKFNCLISDYSRPDTLSIAKSAGKESVNISGLIKLNVQNFDCHNPVMTSDLRKTLKSKEHPNLTIRFLSLDRMPEFGARQNLIKGMVSIELAGVTKRYEVDYKFISEGGKVINLIGTRNVTFSDFKIIPPRKIGGMIQTDNELSVVFNLRLKIL